MKVSLLFFTQPLFVISASHNAIIETLLQPFAEGIMAWPDDRDSFFVRAQYSSFLEPVDRERLLCEQTLSSEVKPLEAAGFRTVRRIEGKFDLGLCLLTKHKKENYGNVSRAWEHLNPGGTLVCVGANQTGVKSFEKNVKKELAVSGSLSKNHCRVFWLEKADETCPDEWRRFSEPGVHIKDTSYLTQPGIFCWEKIDKGSAFLAENLPRKLKGAVADFGSGWGYLSHRILEGFPAVTELDLYEDEYLALEASRLNLESLGLQERAQFQWIDLSAACPKPNHYQWVVMNPPFHRSARTDVSLGIKFIENAARALKRSGSLILVANRQLPYEKTMEEFFRHTERVAENSDFKILLGSGPDTK